jgi:hypothetical protein
MSRSTFGKHYLWTPGEVYVSWRRLRRRRWKAQWRGPILLYSKGKEGRKYTRKKACHQPRWETLGEKKAKRAGGEPPLPRANW